MAITSIRGKQIVDGSVQRTDLDTTTVGQAVAAKLIQGSNISLSSTGADAGTGDVTVSATIPSGFVSKSAAYTLTTADSGKYFICSGGSWTLTLPAPATGLYYQLRNDMGISGTTGTITLSLTGGTIDGVASIALLPQQECTIITDGTNWRTFGLKREVILGTQNITTAQASGVILLPVGYRYFEVEFAGLMLSSGDYMAGQFSQDGGATWIAAAYFFSLFYNNTATTVVNLANENVSAMYIIPSTLAASSPYAEGRLTIYPGSSNTYPTFRTDSCGRNNNGEYQWRIGGVEANAFGPINALKYYPSTAINITNAFVTVKGVV